MKKAIPVAIAIILIGIIVAFSFGKPLYEKYSYGQDRADLNEYFQLFSASDVAIIKDRVRIDDRATMIEGHYYFSQDVTENLFTERFYYDFNEELLLYSKPDTTLEAKKGDKFCTDVKTGQTTSFDAPLFAVKGDELYILAEYIQKFVNFYYEAYKDPNRMVLVMDGFERTLMDIKSDTQVRWKGGVKSEILKDVVEGETVSIVEVMDEWTKVMTEDGFIGYVENNRLENERHEIRNMNATAEPENFVYLTRDHKINLTWHNIEYPQDGYDLQKAVANTKALNVVSPTWYWLCDNEGNFDNVANANYAEGAHGLGLEVWALISNFHSNTDVDSLEVLSYTSKRRYLVENLVNHVVAMGADGINVDFENLTSSTSPHYVQFIRELGIACHDNNLVLSVDNYVPTDYTAHYNRHEQAKFADYIIIMGYDEHYQGDPEAGSVSSVPWMQKGIEDTVALVGKEKVINAVPFYTRVWKTEGGTVSSEAVVMEVQNDFIARNGIETKWDESTYQNYGEMTAGGIYYQVWMEDVDSLQVRLNVMQTAGIAGVASWKLGQETCDVWDLIAAYMGN